VPGTAANPRGSSRRVRSDSCRCANSRAIMRLRLKSAGCCPKSKRAGKHSPGLNGAMLRSIWDDSLPRRGTGRGNRAQHLTKCALLVVRRLQLVLESISFGYSFKKFDDSSAQTSSGPVSRRNFIKSGIVGARLAPSAQAFRKSSYVPLRHDGAPKTSSLYRRGVARSLDISES
jgi:hypothetical protein